MDSKNVRNKIMTRIDAIVNMLKTEEDLSKRAALQAALINLSQVLEWLDE